MRQERADVAIECGKRVSASVNHACSVTAGAAGATAMGNSAGAADNRRRQLIERVRIDPVTRAPRPPAQAAVLPLRDPLRPQRTLVLAGHRRSPVQKRVSVPGMEVMKKVALPAPELSVREEIQKKRRAEARRLMESGTIPGSELRSGSAGW